MNKAHPAHVHEPRVHIAKRDDMTLVKNIVIHFFGIALALAITSAFIVAFTGKNPFELFEKIYIGAIGNEIQNSVPNKKYVETLYNGSILLCLSLAVTPAFKMKFWNIGAEGQALMGCLMSAFFMIKYGNDLDEPILLGLMVLTSVLVGAIWAVIPAICKAIWNTNETLFTLMMNYIAMVLVSYFILVNDKSGHNTLNEINARTGYGYLPELFDLRYIFNILIVFGVFVLMFLYLKFSKHGYEISVVGESQNTARYIGINVKKVIIRTAALSGGICGLVGFMIVSGDQHAIRTDIVGGLGFTAVMVSWMSRFNPGLMALVSFGLTFLNVGAKSATSSLKVDNAIGEVIVAIIVFSIIAVEFFTQYRIKFRSKDKIPAVAAANGEIADSESEEGGEN